MKNIVIFASGEGTNAENIMRHFSKNNTIRVAAVFTGNANAGVLKRAEKMGVPTVVFSKTELVNIASKLEEYQPDLIVLAGFLQMIPGNMITRYEGKIINIHPALLPKFGGKGMYGMNVHRAVLDTGETETGITIHYVDAHYDEGDIIFQKKILLKGNESCGEIAQKVRELEHTHFPEVIESLLNS
ncbi:MAG TPA: phosphoribosylglycinamide formyltransferase [Flavobacterium sp.]|jgi:phosphoribosylglycinamide formyltransferase-1